MRDIKFSTHFPKYHPRAGESTHFVEKIWTAFLDTGKMISLFAVVDYEKLREVHKNFHKKDWTPKRTTIRAGHRWKKGDFFVPKIWTGRPRWSKPIAICEPLEVLETEGLEIALSGSWWLNEEGITMEEFKEIASQDGFDNVDDFELWFNIKKGQTFDGQRIRFA